VLVYRENEKWDGPYKVLSIDNPNVTIDTVNGPQTFRVTQVKPYKRDDTAIEPEQPRLSQHDPPPPVVPIPEERPRRGRPRGSKNKPKDTDEDFRPGKAYTTAFVTRKEEADWELAIKLRQEGKITSPGLPFEESDAKEIDNLLARGVFELVQYDPEKHHGIHIFKSRIVHEIKGKTTDKP
jgi:hypothetical protein